MSNPSKLRLNAIREPGAGRSGDPCCAAVATDTDSSNPLLYLVEDERLVAETLHLVLTKSGYDVVVFSSAESAMAAIETREPQLVLTDVYLSGSMNGVELAELLAKSHRLVRVLLLSAQGNWSEVYREASQRGFRPHIKSKPIPPELLLQELAQVLKTEPAGHEVQRRPLH